MALLDNEPRFDVVVSVAGLHERVLDVVMHYDPQGEPVAYHSPLTHGTVRCAICEAGVRVYLT